MEMHLLWRSALFKPSNSRRGSKVRTDYVIGGQSLTMMAHYPSASLDTAIYDGPGTHHSYIGLHTYQIHMGTCCSIELKNDNIQDRAFPLFPPLPVLPLPGLAAFGLDLCLTLPSPGLLLAVLEALVPSSF